MKILGGTILDAPDGGDKRRSTTTVVVRPGWSQPVHARNVARVRQTGNEQVINERENGGNGRESKG